MRLFTILLITTFFTTSLYAGCDFATGIKETPQGFLYTPECHLYVGQLVQENKSQKDSIDKLNKSIDLKDLAIAKQDERINLWMDTSYKVEDRLNKIEDNNATKNWLFFGAGIGVTILSVWAVGQLK